MIRSMIATMFLASTLVSNQAVWGQIESYYFGGFGDWSNAANWSTDHYPNNGNLVGNGESAWSPGYFGGTGATTFLGNLEISFTPGSRAITDERVGNTLDETGLMKRRFPLKNNSTAPLFARLSRSDKM